MTSFFVAGVKNTGKRHNIAYLHKCFAKSTRNNLKLTSHDTVPANLLYVFNCASVQLHCTIDMIKVSDHIAFLTT